LKPLTQTAAHQIFTDIADDTTEAEDVEKVLSHTDNVPLAIILMAHLVDLEGCSTVLSRWEDDKTSILSEGHDRRSNLDLSIHLSMSSPRITTLPQSKELLSLLAILPDGISDIELSQMNLPIDDMLGCKAALLGTGLAYTTEQNQLKVLVPIQEYMQRFHAPTQELVQPLCKYFQGLVEFHKELGESMQGSEINHRLQKNFANIQRVLLHELKQRSQLLELIPCIISLDMFSKRTGRGSTSLMS
jgi:hypothetical protein